MNSCHFGIRRWLLAALALTAFIASGQTAPDSTTAKENELNVNLQFLGRGEMRYGGFQRDVAPGEEPVTNPRNSFLLSRTRLPITFKRDWLEACVTPQHSGVWGQEGKGSFNLYESWVKMSTHSGLFAQVGRVALDYDDERIIGSDDWAMASSSHDVLRMGYEGHGHKAHVILAYNQNAQVMGNGDTYYVNGAQPYKTMQDMWYHYDMTRPTLGAPLLFMNIGMQSAEELTTKKTIYQQLVGGYASFTPKRWKAEASFYYQFGHNEFDMKIDAWMASVKASFSPRDNFGFVAGYDYLSGDKLFAVPANGNIGVVQHKVIKGFSTVYGSHHQFYGAMDFFYVSTYLNGFTPGLQNAYFGGFYCPLTGLRLDASYHYFATATELVDMEKTLGHQFELQASYAISRDVKLAVGASFMSGSETMERLKRTSANNNLRWGWITLVVTPRIFSTKW